MSHFQDSFWVSLWSCRDIQYRAHECTSATLLLNVVLLVIVVHYNFVVLCACTQDVTEDQLIYSSCNIPV